MRSVTALYLNVRLLKNEWGGEEAVDGTGYIILAQALLYEASCMQYAAYAMWYARVTRIGIKPTRRVFIVAFFFLFFLFYF